MANWAAVFEAAAKFNKYFTYADLALNTAMTGVQVAEMIDPDSVCVAWDVSSLAHKVAEKGPAYDKLLTTLSIVSTDLDNIQHATSNLQDLADSLYGNWKTVQDIQQKLFENLGKLRLAAPVGEQWINNLEKMKPEMASDEQLKNLQDEMNLPALEFAMNSIVLVGMFGGVAYSEWKGGRGPIERPAIGELTLKEQYKRRAKIAVETLFNIGSFAMNIFQIAQLVKQCQQQADQLNKMLSTFDDMPYLRDLNYGCEGDLGRVSAVEQYLQRIMPPDDKGELPSFDDEYSKQLLMDGLNKTARSYDNHISQCVADLDAMYAIILKAINDGVSVSSGPNSDSDLVSGYQVFKIQADLINQVDSAGNPIHSSADRLIASQTILRKILKNVSPKINEIVVSSNQALIDTQVRTYLVTEAKIIAKNPTKLPKFQANGVGFVNDEGIVDQLDAIYPERTLFKTGDSNQVADIVTYIEKCLPS